MSCQISRRDFSRLVGQAALAMAAGSALAPLRKLRAAAASLPAKPNILYILMDDLGWSDCAVCGGKKFSTPHVDKLAAEGMRFTDAYAACPVCSPTRASILTGQYPARLHLTDYIPGKNRQGQKLVEPAWTKELKAEETTIAETLKKAGYATGAIGKWHLGGKPVGHGFAEEAVVTGGSPMAKTPDLSQKQADAAIQFIQAHKGQPFFCYLAFNAVHVPLSPRPELLAKNEDKAVGKTKPQADYLAVMEDADAQIGRVLATLAELGLTENTIVIFVSDNGGFAGVTTNEPLRGSKGMVYEGGIRVPMIVRWPGVVKPGSTCAVPVSTVDHYPTLLEMAGAADDPGHAKVADGISLASLLRTGQAPPREAIYWHYPHYHQGPPSGAIRAGDWKLIEFYEDGRVELYNLKDDLGEKTDLAAKLPEKARELKAKLAAWRQSVGAQMPMLNPNFGKPSSQPDKVRVGESES